MHPTRRGLTPRRADPAKEMASPFAPPPGAAPAAASSVDNNATGTVTAVPTTAARLGTSGFPTASPYLTPYPVQASLPQFLQSQQQVRGFPSPLPPGKYPLTAFLLVVSLHFRNHSRVLCDFPSCSTQPHPEAVFTWNKSFSSLGEPY